MWEQTRSAFEEAAGRVAQAFARLLPGLLAMLVLLVLTAVAAFLVSSAVRRICARLEVDRRLREWGMAAPAQPGRLGPTRLAARLAGWAVVALGVVAGLGAFESAATSALAQRLLEYVPHVVVALVVFSAGLAGSRAVERAVLIGAVNMGLHSARLIGLGVRWLIVILASAVALEHLGVGGAILTSAFVISFGGIVLALSLAIGFGARGVVERSLERLMREQAEHREGGDEKIHHL
ncbi:MAG: hypothetical protein U0229_26185 [Anaeromyxobacter sp.]